MHLARFGANLATLGNAVLGIGGIIYILAGNKLWGMLLLLGGIAFDGLDGILSRRAGTAPNRFGRIADSVADAVTFGLGPGFLLAVHTENTGLWAPWQPVSVTVALVVSALALTRLFIFTTRTYELPYFRGASTPQTTLAIVLLVLLFDTPGYLNSNPPILLVCSVLVAVLMVLPVPYPKMRRGEAFRWPMALTAIVAALALVSVQFRPGSGTPLMILGEAATGALVVGVAAYYIGGPFTVKTVVVQAG